MLPLDSTPWLSFFTLAFTEFNLTWPLMAQDVIAWTLADGKGRLSASLFSHDSQWYGCEIQLHLKLERVSETEIFGARVFRLFTSGVLKWSSPGNVNSDSTSTCKWFTFSLCFLQAQVLFSALDNTRGMWEILPEQGDFTGKHRMYWWRQISALTSFSYFTQDWIRRDRLP